MPSRTRTTVAVPPPRRVATYTSCRYSRDDEPGWGLDRQEAMLRAYLATRPDWQPVADYQDHVASRYRPALDHALADGRAGRFEVLLVTAPERLGRQVQALAACIHDFDHAGVAVHSVVGGLDTATPFGRIVLTVLAVFAPDAALARDAYDRIAAARTATRDGGTARRRRTRRAAGTPPASRLGEPPQTGS